MPDKAGKKAVILSSGGLDSTTVMAIAKNEGYDLFSLSFDYGQRHVFELEAAKQVADHFEARKHLVIQTDLTKIGGSALTDHMEVPKGRTCADDPGQIPSTYVPARNTIFLAYALAWAEVILAGDIFIGVNVIDYSGYPDCRPEYIAAFQNMANLATRANVEGQQNITIHTPLIDLSKAQIIQKGLELGVDYALTHTCYDPSGEGRPCGHCDACQLRQKGFQMARFTDPLRYTGET